MRGVLALQNAAADAVHQLRQDVWGLPDEAISYLYDQTSTAGLLRSLSVELNAQLGVKGGYAKIQPRPAIDFFIESCDRHEELVDHNSDDRQALWTNVDLCRFPIHTGKDCKGREPSKGREASNDVPVK